MSAARKRQPIRVLPLEVARDAIRQGEPAAVVVACVADSPAADRVKLALELIEAAAAILAVDGVHYTTVSTGLSGVPRVGLQMYGDDVAAMQSVLLSIDDDPGSRDGYRVGAVHVIHCYAGSFTRRL